MCVEVYFSKIFIYLAVLRLSCGMWESSLQYAESFSCGIWILSCSMWDLVPWPGIKPEPLALRLQCLSHWTARAVPGVWTFKLVVGLVSVRWNLSRVEGAEGLSQLDFREKAVMEEETVRTKALLSDCSNVRFLTVSHHNCRIEFRETVSFNYEGWQPFLLLPTPANCPNLWFSKLWNHIMSWKYIVSPTLTQ